MVLFEGGERLATMFLTPVIITVIIINKHRVHMITALNNVQLYALHISWYTVFHHILGYSYYDRRTDCCIAPPMNKKIVKLYR